MERIISKVEFPAPRPFQVTRVAAYARVSSGKDAMLHSLSAQVAYYSGLIQKHPGWLYCGVYADEALTGTKDNRANFQRLLTACRNGEVDLVLTKSISRFARNTVTLLESVRELKGLGVDVYFEEQKIHTLTAEGELMLTILASFAQEESRSASENQKWRIKRNFEQGKPWVGFMLGYRLRNGEYQIVPDEAKTVKRIYSDYLSGMGYIAICKALNEEGITTRDGNPWYVGPLMKVLTNYCYTGNLLLQRRYRENYITKRAVVNHGELPMYHVEGFHEPIIPMGIFQAVQEERAQRAERFSGQHPNQAAYPFTEKIVCGCCGASFNRKTARGKKIWICRTYNTTGKAACPASKAVPETILLATTAEVMGLDEFDPHIFAETVSKIVATEENTLVYHFRDGPAKAIAWTDRSRSESWTPEMRAAAGRKTRERMHRNG